MWQRLKRCKNVEDLESILRSDDSFRIQSKRQLKYFAERLEAEGASLELTLEIACAFENDVLPCNEGHRYFPRSPEVWVEMKEGLQQLLGKNAENNDVCIT